MSSEVINDTVKFNYTYGFVPNFLINSYQNPSSTIVQTFTHDPHDWMTFNVNMNQMKTATFDALYDFIMAMRGSGDNFLLKDDNGFGYQAARNSIGTGDGVEDTFQLLETRSVGSTTSTYERWSPIASTESVWVANSLKTAGVHYNMSAGGLVVFTGGNIPSGAQDVEASFDYHRLVRFIGSLGAILRAFNNRNAQLAMREESAKVT